MESVFGFIITAPIVLTLTLLYYISDWYIRIVDFLTFTPIAKLIWKCTGADEQLISKVFKWSGVILVVIAANLVDTQEVTVAVLFLRGVIYYYFAYVTRWLCGMMVKIFSDETDMSSLSKKDMGMRYERQVAKRLSGMGYRDIKLTKASGDFGADIVARKGNVRYSIQCKHYKGNVGVDAVQQAIAGMAYYKCDAAMVITNSKFTPAARELARKSGVTLLDRFQGDNFIDRMEELDAILED